MGAVIGFVVGYLITVSEFETFYLIIVRFKKNGDVLKKIRGTGPFFFR